MHPALLAALVAVSSAAALLAAPEPAFSDVFSSGHDGYASVRIPSVVVTRDGTVLAVAEGRQRPRDQAENDIVLRRSTDHGMTWQPLQVVAADGAHSLNNPTAVVEQASGRVFLMYQRIPSHLTEHSQETAAGFDGPDVYRNLLVWSDDDGATWTEPLDVTRTTKRPHGATTVASGPGIGIQLTRGPHAGRLLIPFNEGPYWKWQNFSVISDDQGKSWRYGDNVPGAMIDDPAHGERSQINEVQMVELSDGSVLLNSRPFAGARVRKSSVSRDGGVSWSAVEDVPDLPCPSCMASILRHSFDDADGRGRLLFSGPRGTRRAEGTISLSTDDGATWPVRKTLWPGPFAYSVLTRLPDGTIGCLFEADDYARIVFARIPIEWITP